MPELGDGVSVRVTLPTGIGVQLPSTPETRVSVLLATGPPGPRGVSGGGFVHRQPVPAAQWTVTHDLGTVIDPVLVLDDEPGRPVWADVTHSEDLNTAYITLPAPATGSAYF